MTLSLFVQRAATIIAAFAFAALFMAMINADAALIGHGLFALLPFAIVVFLLVRIACQSGRAARSAG